MLRSFVMLLPTVGVCELYRMPLSQRERSFDEIAGSLKEYSSKVQAQDPGRTVPVQLRDFMDTSYSGEITIGTPGQTELVIMDTGSSNVWAPSAQPPKGTKHLYNHSASSTYEKNGTGFLLIYGSGPIFGTLSRDRVSVGNLALDNFTIAEIDNAAFLGSTYTENPWFDGIFGLGFSPLCADYNLTAPMEALVKSGQLAEPVFAFYLGGSPGESKSELVFGGVDKAHFTGDFTYVPLTEASYWKVQLSAIKFGGTAISMSYDAAIIDSGTSYIAGPKADVDPIVKKIGAVEKEGRLEVDCNSSAPDLTFSLGGVDFPLTKEDMIVSQKGSTCILGVFSIQDKQWVLGDVFMRKYYVKFDFGQKRVGIAVAAVGTSDISPTIVV